QSLTDANGNFIPSPLSKNSTVVDALPSVEVRYALAADSAIRVAYGRGVARPNFGDLAPYFVIDDTRKRISSGNPNLKATNVNNYDLLFEQYLKPLGMIQAGFFYKDIGRPIYPISRPVTSGPYEGFLENQQLNGSSAWVYGFEAAYQQRLGFLPSPLNAF